MKTTILVGTVVLCVIAGWTDLRSRRIPNWLTLPAFAVGVALNAVAGGGTGLRLSLLGAALGLLLLLPFVLLRALGAGDWKLAGAVGAFVGPGVLANLLMGSVFVAGVMALALATLRVYWHDQSCLRRPSLRSRVHIYAGDDYGKRHGEYERCLDHYNH
ncbi:MAG: A24 family peptidase [Candidatus Sulfotelmatobacter sp.]